MYICNWKYVRCDRKFKFFKTYMFIIYSLQLHIPKFIYNILNLYKYYIFCYYGIYGNICTNIMINIYAMYTEKSIIHCMYMHHMYIHYDYEIDE